jgi:hypothetical protein
MPKQRTYYCPICDRELWPTRDGRYWTCSVVGHTKLLSEKHCNAHCTMTTVERADYEQRQEYWKEQWKRNRQLDGVAKARATKLVKTLPLCGVEKYINGKRKKYHIWWLLGDDRKFEFVCYGFREGYVLAFDPTRCANSKDKRRGVVSLKPLTERQLLHRAQLLVDNAA